MGLSLVGLHLFSRRLSLTLMFRVLGLRTFLVLL